MKIVDIGQAIVVLYENHKMAEQDLSIRKPVAYSLYKTWQYIDRIENERVVTIEN